MTTTFPAFISVQPLYVPDDLLSIKTHVRSCLASPDTSAHVSALFKRVRIGPRLSK